MRLRTETVSFVAMAAILVFSGCRDDNAAATSTADGTGESGEDAPDADGPDDGPDDEGPDGDGTTGGEDADDTADDTAGDDTTGGEPPPPTSPSANVRFKGPAQLRNDFAQTLGLPVDELCFELGTLSCTDDVHTVTLGGVEPDALGIYEPASTSNITTPIAVDRVALAACGRRVDADLQGKPVIFDLTLDGEALADPTDASVAASVTTLYRRALLRDPTDAELSNVLALYDDVAASVSDRPARDWAVGSCFAVLTTMESLFY